MGVKERILALRILEYMERDPAYLNKLGVEAVLVNKEPDSGEEKND